VYVSGTACGIYSHFIYSFDLGSSFCISQLQVARHQGPRHHRAPF
jgi:hypothetical protein